MDHEFCPKCQGEGYIELTDYGGEPQLDEQGEPETEPCQYCRGHGILEEDDY